MLRVLQPKNMPWFSEYSFIRLLQQFVQTHTRQFLLYLVSGGASVVVDFGSYFLLIWLGSHYVTANVVGNTLGFLSAFFFHKYFVFKKYDKSANHFVRYCLLTLFNVVVQTLILVLLVEWFSFDQGSAKLLSWIISTLGNFFFYKFFVYV